MSDFSGKKALPDFSTKISEIITFNNHDVFYIRRFVWLRNHHFTEDIKMNKSALLLLLLVGLVVLIETTDANTLPGIFDRKFWTRKHWSQVGKGLKRWNQKQNVENMDFDDEIQYYEE
uniref:uncharacterized protein LOC108950761 isoform X1 n=1 Tax=Ciona intestinalis TaxID=7719 RepID=UPI000EF50FBC|nr:uncharacterized protein LOC108950761 isoform X1 [Ciona intestinalis]|eukprot:XP_026695555.1 uncharacterized protein LOC108950761 isoform X1 [Ciona intestinalis]